MTHMKLATAVYQDGILKLSGPIPGLAEGDRVEVVVVRIVPVDRNASEEVARRERIDKKTQEIVAETDHKPNEDCGILEALNANRLREGARPLIPSAEGR